MTIASTLNSAAAPVEPRARVGHGRRRHKTRASIVWVGVLLLTAEAGVRARAWYRHGSAAPVADLYESDDLLGRRPRAGAALSGSHRTLKINRWGFRGADIPKSKPPGTLRIAAIGDSTTFGLEAADDDAVWVQRLTRILNEQPDGTRHDRHDRHDRYDAINAGVPGYTLEVSARQLSERVLPFDPDLVIVLSVTGDLSGHARRQFRSSFSDAAKQSQVARLLHENSLLLNLIRVNAVAFSAGRTQAQRHARLDERGIQRYVGELLAIVKIAREASARVILCTCPRAFGDETAPTDQYHLARTALAHNPALTLAGLNDAYDRYNEAVRRVARETNTPLADLARLIPKREKYFTDAIHFNDAGHRRVAEILEPWIRRASFENQLAREHP